jgi:FAD/FMN-containing dehydrogenase
MTTLTTQTTRLSWGHFPYHPQAVHSIAWLDLAHPQWRALRSMLGTTLAFGNGRSYGDSCLAQSGHVLEMSGLDRIIHADWEHGIILAEPGITLEKILEVAIPRGWILPVMPGTKYATLGGAIANDVHGKNHHVRGTFGRHVRSLCLARSDGHVMECSPATNPEMFAATIGGLGLTGLILRAEIQLMPITSSLVDVKKVCFPHLDGFFEASEALDASHEYNVAWIDCLARGPSLGRGFCAAGNHAPNGPLEFDRKKKRKILFTPPISPINPLTLRAFNGLYYRRQCSRASASSIGYDRYFFPLDGLLDWNRLYGAAGFQQYQCVLPAANAREALRAALSTISASGTGSFLAVLKRYGDLRSPGLLSFPLAGTSLALDFPQRDAANQSLFSSLDAIVREAGGRIYPAKDAHMSGADFRLAYPHWPELEVLRDPAMMSRFWERVTRT